MNGASPPADVEHKRADSTIPQSVERPQAGAGADQPQAAASADQPQAGADQPQAGAGADQPESYLALAAENDRLQQEVAKLRGEAERRRHPGRVRSIAVGVLVFLSCLGIFTSAITVWSNSTLLNTDTYLRIVGPVGQDPQVISAVSNYAANQVVTLLKVQERAQTVLPSRIDFLAVPLTLVVTNFTQASIAKLMHTPTFQRVWIDLNRRAYNAILAVLRGQSSTLYISNGALFLNLVPVIDEALQYVQQHLPGILSQKVKLPQPTQLEVPKQAQQRLSQALGVPIPSNLGQIQLFQSEKLTTAQQLFRLWNLLTVVLPLLTAVLIVAALWVSPDRRRTLMWLGIGVAIVFIIAKILTGYLQQYIDNAAMSPLAKSIVPPAVQTLLSSLSIVTTWLLVGGIVLAVVAFLAGKLEWFKVAFAYLRSAYYWVVQKVQSWLHRPPRAATGAATPLPG